MEICLKWNKDNSKDICIKNRIFGILIDLSYYMKLSYGIYFLDSCKWQEDNHIRIDEVANFRYIFIFVEFDLTLE